MPAAPIRGLAVRDTVFFARKKCRFVRFVEIAKDRIQRPIAAPFLHDIRDCTGIARIEMSLLPVPTKGLGNAFSSIGRSGSFLAARLCCRCHDLEAQVGSCRRTMLNHCTSSDRPRSWPKLRRQAACHFQLFDSGLLCVSWIRNAHALLPHAQTLKLCSMRGRRTSRHTQRYPRVVSRGRTFACLLQVLVAWVHADHRMSSSAGGFAERDGCAAGGRHKTNCQTVRLICALVSLGHLTGSFHERRSKPVDVQRSAVGRRSGFTANHLGDITTGEICVRGVFHAQ